MRHTARPATAPALAALAAIACTVASPPAVAAEVIHDNLYPAVAACQPALPAYDGAFRKRPRGVRNEGAAPAFISCALHGDAFVIARNTYVSVVLANTTGQSVSTSCTLVDGQIGYGQPPSFSSTRTVGHHGSLVFAWSAADNGGQPFLYPAISCVVPPGLEVAFVAHSIRVEVGD